MSTVVAVPEKSSEKSRYAKFSWMTAAVLVWFHVQAVAAFWSFTWTNLAVALVLYWVAVGLGISMGYHRLHTHRGFKTSKLVRVFPRHLRHADARRRPDLLGRHAPPASPVLRPAARTRTRRASAASGRTSAGSCSARRSTTTPRGCRATRRTSAKDPFYRWLTTYHWVPLTVLGFVAARHRRMGPRQLGDLPPRRGRPALDLAGELGHAHVGAPTLRHEGRLAEHLVGRAPDLRRGLAQQPPRPSDLRAPRPGVVRVRHHLARAQAACGPSAWSGTSASPASARAAEEEIAA